MEISISLDPSVDNDLQKYLAGVNSFDDVSIHCDVMRAPFVERNAVTLEQYNYIMHNASKAVDVHLMADVSFMGEILQAKRDVLPRSVTFHVEAVPSAFMARVYLGGIRQLGVEAGVAIDLSTSIESVDPGLLRACDVITIMSVKAGASGQKFNEVALEKAREIKQIAPNARLIMDGGINAENIHRVKAAGVDTAVIGSYIYRSEDRGSAIRLCKDKADNRA